MTARTATTACLLLGITSLAAGRSGPEQPLPRIASPEALAIEMAKAWLGLHLSLAGDRERDVEEVSDFGRTKVRGGQTR
jgi:hypothetical protein